MQARDFCFWLQGLFEVGDPVSLNADQVNLIKTHLSLVFKHDVSIKPKEMEHYQVSPRPTVAGLGPLVDYSKLTTTTMC